AIDTKGEWVTYTLYIESSELSTGTISVVLSNGIGSLSTRHMSKGYAFFDNVILEKVEKDDYASNSISDTVAKYSMKVGNAEFNFASSTTSIPYTPSKYTLVAGYGSGDNASTSSTYTARGIIDIASFERENAASSLSALNKTLQSAGKTLSDLTVPEVSIGSRMLYMQNKQATAFGYRSSVAMNFATNKYYEVSVWANTYLTKGNATVRLTDGTNEDSNGFILTADSYDKWTKYTFYVEANQFRNTSLYLELWLGFGGQNDTDSHAVGAVLFDCVSLNEISASDYANAAADDVTKSKISLLTDEENMKSVSLRDFNVLDSETALAGRSTSDVVDADNFVANDYFKENPLKPVDKDSSIFGSEVLAINNYYPSSTTISTLNNPGENKDVDTSKLLNIEANKTYAISMYVKTNIVDTSKGLTVELLKYNADYKGKDFAGKYTSVGSFSNLNTENLESQKGLNDYTLITFYVQGAEIEDTLLAIAFSLGSGDGSDFSTLTMGYAYISSIYLEDVTYSQYTTASSSTVVTKVPLAGSSSNSEVASNGFFNFIDFSSTINTFGDDWSSSPALALPTGWSLNKSSALTIDPEDDFYGYMAGILNLKNDSQLTAFGTTATDFYKGAANYFNVDDNPNVLAIKKGDDRDVDMLGFTSSSISLSANSYYEFSVWAKANVGDQFSIVLKTAATSDEDKYSLIEGDGKWHRYSIFVQTGISSVSVTLSLNAGYEGHASRSCSVFFTNATYNELTSSSVFDNANDNESESDLRYITQSWLVDSFDDVDLADSVVSPKNFTGALVDNEASNDSDTLISGVIDKNRTNFTDIGINTDSDEDIKLYNAIFNDANTNVGNRVLVLYAKDLTSYAYTSNTATISAGKYYKISIWILTYKLAAGDDVDEYFIPTATITLKANNKTYEFGRRLTADSSDYDKLRIVNTSTYGDDGVEQIGKWTEYSFYIYAEDDISDTTATLSVGLGFNNKDYRMSGYVFVDNFSVTEIDEANFIARKDQYAEDENGTYYKDGDNYVEITAENPAPSGATLYKKLTDSEVVDLDNSLNSILTSDEIASTNYRIVFTADDSTAEPEEEEPVDTEDKKDPMIWLYVSIGAVSVIIVAIVIIYLIKKVAPKRKKKLVKKSKSSGGKPSSGSNGSAKRDQFGK
ncbi:MAG: hypothetical protein K2G37_00015, partial [Clostridia bacterium]|nr:hypothetical protein [Clostridia bacterium]